MATLGRRLCLVGLILCCVFVSSKGDKWRAVAKAVRHCPGPKLAVRYEVTKLYYSNKGEFFHVDGNIAFTRPVRFTWLKVDVFRDSGRLPLKVITYQRDACEMIMGANDIIAGPIFGPRGIPRQCEFGIHNRTFHLDYDLHSDNIGFNFYRGNFVVEIRIYDGREVVDCMKIHVIVKKDTLN